MANTQHAFRASLSRSTVEFGQVLVGGYFWSPRTINMPRAGIPDVILQESREIGVTFERSDLGPTVLAEFLFLPDERSSQDLRGAPWTLMGAERGSPIERGTTLNATSGLSARDGHRTLWTMEGFPHLLEASADRLADTTAIQGAEHLVAAFRHLELARMEIEALRRTEPDDLGNVLLNSVLIEVDRLGDDIEALINGEKRTPEALAVRVGMLTTIANELLKVPDAVELADLLLKAGKELARFAPLIPIIFL